MLRHIGTVISSQRLSLSELWLLLLLTTGTLLTRSEQKMMRKKWKEVVELFMMILCDKHKCLKIWKRKRRKNGTTVNWNVVVCFYLLFIDIADAVVAAPFDVAGNDLCHHHHHYTTIQVILINHRFLPRFLQSGRHVTPVLTRCSVYSASLSGRGDGFSNSTEVDKFCGKWEGKITKEEKISGCRMDTKLLLLKFVVCSPLHIVCCWQVNQWCSWQCWWCNCDDKVECVQSQ